jgi:hypothetical protein
MKEYIVLVKHRYFEYESDPQELNKDDFLILESLVEKASSGKLDYFRIECKGELVYFPEKLLQESIIIIRTVN